MFLKRTFVLKQAHITRSHRYELPARREGYLKADERLSSRLLVLEVDKRTELVG